MGQMPHHSMVLKDALPIYPHRVNHLLAFVTIYDFMLLDNIFTLIV